MPKFYTSESREIRQRLEDDAIEQDLKDDTMHGYTYGKPMKSADPATLVAKKKKKKRSKK